MQRERPPGFNDSDPTEVVEDHAEEVKLAIDTLPEALGYVETEELGLLRRHLIEAMASDTGVRDLATQYHLLAEEVVNQHRGGEFAKAQVGLILRMGLIRRDSGRTDDFIEDLHDALTYADNLGLTDIVLLLEETLDSLTDSI